MEKIGLIERIEAAIRHQDKLHESCKEDGSYGKFAHKGYVTHKALADLFRWASGEEQDTWTDKDLLGGGEEE